MDAKSWYAVENGVWFTATSVRGPWVVATSVPAAIYTIPSSSPLHYVTYVKTYSSSESTVYVGSTPGYHGEYVDPVSNVVVYGTGYYYDPWIGTAWYGPPVTYGFGVATTYTPWAGWGLAFGVGWAWGAATVYSGWGLAATRGGVRTAGDMRMDRLSTGAARPMVTRRRRGLGTGRLGRED